MGPNALKLGCFLLKVWDALTLKELHKDTGLNHWVRALVYDKRRVHACVLVCAYITHSPHTPRAHACRYSTNYNLLHDRILYIAGHTTRYTYGEPVRTSLLSKKYKHNTGQSTPWQ